ncbi:MAG: DUF4080 domain-containing protein [Fastidiosipilaceae bacterium]
MLNIVLVAVNARFTHTNPALRAMRAYVRSKLRPSLTDGRLRISLVELTINEPLSWLEDALLKAAGDVYLFSAYIWNIEIVRKLCEAIKKGMPNVITGIGGPEVSYTAKEELTRTPQADLVLCGEGEFTLYKMAEFLALSDRAETFQSAEKLDALTNELARSIPGLIGREHTGPPPIQVPLDDIPYYWERGLPDLRHRMIYYESSRGCPFSCTYCLSSVETGIRYRSLELVLAELDQLSEDEAMLVKFVDRSFNADTDRALAIWRHLISAYRPGQRTTFHFEIEPNLLNEEALRTLETAPDGLFQLEIGVQTTDPEVLRVIRRHGDVRKIHEAVTRLRKAGNMHLHLDLIAGLPGESLAGIVKSFDDVMAMHPHALQLGFLKVLKGTAMEQTARERGMRWRDNPPYEIIASDALSFADLALLKEIETLLDRYYNSGHHADIILSLCEVRQSAFEFFHHFADFCRGQHMIYGRFAKELAAAQLYRFILSADEFFADRPEARAAIASEFEQKWRASVKRGVIGWDQFLEKFF